MIYICIPAYNEERTIGVLLWKLRQVMTEFPRDYEVLVVDDASTDATGEVLEPYTRILPLTVHRNREREGYAAALERLIEEAVRRSPYPRRDVIVTLQADFTEEPDEIPTLVKRIEGGVDVVSSAARTRREDAPRNVRWSRAALGTLLRRKSWPEGISDPISGFRAYRIITLKRLLEERNGKPLIEWDGWAANVALLRAVIPYSRRIEEVPVELTYERRNRESRLRPWETGRQLFRLIRTAEEKGELGSRVRRGRRRGGRRRRGRRGQARRAGQSGDAAQGDQRRRRGGRGRRGQRGQRSQAREGAAEGRTQSQADQGQGRQDGAQGERSGGRRRSSGGRRRSGRRRSRQRRSGGQQQSGAQSRSDEGTHPGESSRSERPRRPRGRSRSRGRRRGGRRTGEPTSGKEGSGSSRKSTANDS